MKSKSESSDSYSSIKSLNNLWEETVHPILTEESPLQGVYCVYSMYWEPTKMIGEIDKETAKKGEFR